MKLVLEIYDFYYIDDKISGLGVFDVSGHGISSGLITMIAKSILSQSFTEGINLELNELFTIANTRLQGDLKNVDKLMEFNSWVWKQKKDKKVSLKSPVEIANVPIEIKLYEKDLIECHKLVVK